VPARTKRRKVGSCFAGAKIESSDYTIMATVTRLQPST
jgi:hypothetical protein